MPYHKIISPLTVWIISLLTATACTVAPEPVLQVTPVAEVVEWRRGEQLVWQETETHRVGVSFNKQTDDMLALRLVVQNTSNDKILLSPESVTYQYCRQPLQPGKQIECIKKSPVVDPELAIFDNRREQNHRLAVHAAHERTQAVMGTLNLMTGVVAAASGDTEAIDEVLENQRDLENIDQSVQIRRLHSRLENWRQEGFLHDETFRKTSLRSGETWKVCCSFPSSSKPSFSLSRSTSRARPRKYSFFSPTGAPNN